MDLSKFSITIEVDSDIESVWRELTNWESQSNWMLLTKVWSQQTQNIIGTKIFAFTGIAPMRFPTNKRNVFPRIGILDEMEISEWRPPTFCKVIHTGKIIKGIGTFELVKISDQRIRFHWYEEIAAPPIVLALIRPGILLSVRYSLWRFARSVA